MFGNVRVHLAHRIERAVTILAEFHRQCIVCETKLVVDGLNYEFSNDGSDISDTTAAFYLRV